MGATVSTGKLVAAFTDPAGQPFYVMFEETFEKNVSPHTPRWNCYAMGNLQRIMRAIFLASSSCEGGMLQGSGGRNLTPEGYIAGWLKELANPVEFRDQTITLEVGTGWYSPLSTDGFEGTKALLENLGRAEMAQALEQGESVSLSLHADIALINALYEGEALQAWKIIRPNDAPVYAQRIPRLGYEPKKTKAFEIVTPHFRRISEKDNNVLIQGEDGNWRCEGWDYNYVSLYVGAYWEAELREPGTYRTRIKAYRQAIHGAPLIPSAGVKIIVDTTVELQSYEQSKIDRATKALPHVTTLGMIQLDVPESSDNLYWVTGLPLACTKWSIEEEPLVFAPNEQLSLLAG